MKVAEVVSGRSPSIISPSSAAALGIKTHLNYNRYGALSHKIMSGGPIADEILKEVRKKVRLIHEPAQLAFKFNHSQAD